MIVRIRQYFFILAILILIFVFAVLFLSAANLYKRSFSISSNKSIIFEKFKGDFSFKNSGNQFILTDDNILLKKMPVDNSDTINLLILGIRGENDNNGGLLTDTILLFSYDFKSGNSNITIIPRDLFVYVPGLGKREKVNAVYNYGMVNGGIKEGLAFSRHFFSRLLGVYINHVVVVDFNMFLQIVDLVGGIDITLENDFIEDKQWDCDIYGRNCEKFVLPKGVNHLEGEVALKFIRSRFSSSDFDRQQRVVMVIKAVADKARLLGFDDINKITQLYMTIGKHIKTDVGLSNIIFYYNLLHDKINFDKIQTRTLLPDGASIIQTNVGGQYVLLPIRDEFIKLRNSLFK